MKTKYKYILFDWDGCLGNTLDIWLAGYRQILGDSGVKISDQQIVSEFFGTSYGGPEKYGLDGQVFYKKLSPIVTEGLKVLDLNDNALEMLKAIKGLNIVMAVVSTSYRDVVIPALKHNLIDQYFDVIIGWEDTKEHKPDPEPLEKAMKLLGISDEMKQSVVIIGDSKHDIGAGKNAGISTCLYHNSNHSKFYEIGQLKQLQPDYIISNFNELVHIVQG